MRKKYSELDEIDKEKRRETVRRWRLRNKEKEKEYRLKNKDKASAYFKEYYEKNRITILEKNKTYYDQTKEQHEETRYKYNSKFIEKYLLNRARHRAKRSSLDFNISEDDIVIPDVCPVFGFPLTINKDHQKSNSISLDRINPKLGYVKGNLQVLSHLANTMKQNATPEELHKFADWVKANVPLEVPDA